MSTAQYKTVYCTGVQEVKQLLSKLFGYSRKVFIKNFFPDSTSIDPEKIQYSTHLQYSVWTIFSNTVQYRR